MAGESITSGCAPQVSTLTTPIVRQDVTQRERSVGLSQTGIPPVAPAAIFEDGGHCAAHQGGDSARRGLSNESCHFSSVQKPFESESAKRAKYETASPTQILFHNQLV